MARSFLPRPASGNRAKCRQADPRVAALAAAGAIRFGLFLPQYAEDAAGTSWHRHRIYRDRAYGRARDAPRHCGACHQYPSPKAAVAGLQGGIATRCFWASNRRVSSTWIFRRRCFSSTTRCLVQAGSAIKASKTPIAADSASGWSKAMRPPWRCAVSSGAPSLIGVELPESAVDLIRDRKVDPLAFPRDQLMSSPSGCPARACWRKVTASTASAWRLQRPRRWLSYRPSFRRKPKHPVWCERAIDARRLAAASTVDGLNRDRCYCRRDRLQHRQPGVLLLGDEGSGFVRRHRMRIAAGGGELFLHVRIADDLGDVRARPWR